MAPSAERLRMLLVLDPADAEAALLLGKVLAGMARWQEALTWLDAASANGRVLPAGLRDEVSDALRREVHDSEAQRQRLQARERGEVRTLRAEAKKLRADNVILEQQVTDLDKRVGFWSIATVVVSGSASALLLAAILFGGPDAPEVAPVAASEALAVTAPAAPADAAPEAVSAAEPTAAPVAAAPKPAAPTPAAPAAKAGVLTTHTVASGENLSVIAQKYYGKSSEWRKILTANEKVLKGDVRKLRPGQKLTIPK